MRWGHIPSLPLLTNFARPDTLQCAPNQCDEMEREYGRLPSMDMATMFNGFRFQVGGFCARFWDEGLKSTPEAACTQGRLQCALKPRQTPAHMPTRSP